jgi:hypothetical protein
MKDEKLSQENETESTEEKRADIRERIALTSQSVDRLNSWVEQLKAKHRGVTLNRKGLVNWLIEAHAAELSPSEEEALSRVFFDELKFLEQVMGDMRRAKAEGRSVSLDECMAASRAAPSVVKRPSKARKATLKTDPATP